MVTLNLIMMFIGYATVIPIVMFLIYHIIKAFVLAIDFLRWECFVTGHEYHVKHSLQYIKFIFHNWRHLFCYSGETSYEIKGYVWEGYGTGRISTFYGESDEK